jgi:predicted transcriptional regulator of viral defense system
MRNKLTFVYTKEKFIWGIKEEWVTSTDKVRISDLEKTLVDALAHPEYCGGITEIAKGIWMARERIDFQKLKKYVIKYDKNVVAKRLGYILDIFRFDQAELLDLLRSYVKERYDIFDPTLPLKRVDKNNWRLIDNVGQKQMLDLIRH